MANHPTRKLAAIMFTDMVGYTALMQENEKLAKENRDRHRNVLQVAVENFHGKILQYYGDGTLSVFDSSVEAVQCAVGIQNSLLRPPEIPLRIGIHSGDVAYDQEGVYGDGVNIASRIESLAIPGSVLVSEKVFDDLKNHPDFQTKSLGLFELKNVKKPLEVFAISHGSLKVPSKKEIRGKATTIYQSIAVLPFVNMSADPENEYFSDGIAEEILNALTKVQDMQVTSRTSSFVFKNKNVDIREIGRVLDAKTVLEGSVRKSGDRVRITAQLIDTENGYHLWSETYDRNLTNIFELQDELSIKIVHQLRKALGGERHAEALVKHKKTNEQAYSQYLKGMYSLNRYTPEDVRKAMQYFEEAIRMQDDFANPYAQLAYCYGYLGATGQLKAENAYKKANELGEKARQLDPTLYQAYLIMALGDLYYTGDMDRAYLNFMEAMRLNPGAADIYQYYTIYLGAIGNLNEALENIEKAVDLDPLSLPINNWYGMVLLMFKRYDDAIARYDFVLSLDPTFRAALEAKGWAQFFKGEKTEAIKTFEQYQSMTGSPLKGLNGLGFAYGATGQTEKAREIIKKMEQRKQVEPDVDLDIDFAMVYAGLGEYEKSVEHLKRSFAMRNGLTFFIHHPVWDKTRKDENFVRFMRAFAAEKGLDLAI
jgi:TolB-like protein